MYARLCPSFAEGGLLPGPVSDRPHARSHPETLCRAACMLARSLSCNTVPLPAIAHVQDLIGALILAANADMMAAFALLVGSRGGACGPRRGGRWGAAAGVHGRQPIDACLKGASTSGSNLAQLGAALHLALRELLCTCNIDKLLWWFAG